MNKKTLVLGASLKSNRYSNYAIKKLVEEGVDVIAIGTREGVVSGVQIHIEPSHYDDIHTVMLYLNPKNQNPYYDYILSLKPKRVIFNPGTENPELFSILKTNNIPFEMTCSLVLLSTNQY